MIYYTYNFFQQTYISLSKKKKNKHIFHSQHIDCQVLQHTHDMSMI